MFDESLLPHIEEQAERSKEVASIVVQADEDCAISDDETDGTKRSPSAASDRNFQDLLRNKQVHVKDSLSILR